MKNMEDLRRWLSKPERDYDEGVRLLERYGGNAHLVHSYRQRAPRWAMEELVADLDGLWRTYGPGEQAGGSEVQTLGAMGRTHKSASDVAEARVAEARQEAGGLWVRIGRLTTALYEAGEGNQPETVEKRRRLLEERAPLIARHAELWERIEEYERTGTFAEEGEQEKEAADQTGTLKDIGDLALARRIHSARTSCTRYENLLRYQSTKAMKEANEMPPCPRRSELERLLREKRTELAMLTEELKGRNGNR